jgi:uncharacterized protein (DUF2252 family)
MLQRIKHVLSLVLKLKLMTQSIFDRIQAFNQRRDPERLERKYQAMRTNPFAFFRGTCHLFYEDLPADAALNSAPPAWICGDLHLENFGSYRGDNDQVYFDINDFDDAALAPCTWDVVRFLTSMIIAEHTLGVNSPEALALCHCYLEAYINALAAGKARSVETETATGMVQELLLGLKERKRKKHLKRRTEEKDGMRQFAIGKKGVAPITPEEREAIAAMMETWAAKQPNPEFFKLLDVAGRIAGNGSLGVSRYFLLIEGNGSPNKNYFLDLKQSVLSPIQPYLKLPQPDWENEADRVVSIQTRMQATSQAMLSSVVMDGKPYVLRALQPEEDKLSLELWNGELRRLQDVMATMGEVTAWAQLRSSGRQGSASADDFIQFANHAESWEDTVLSYAKSYAEQVEAYYDEFCQILDGRC